MKLFPQNLQNLIFNIKFFYVTIIQEKIVRILADQENKQPPNGGFYFGFMK